jgi:predicted nucleic acid-binding protein
MILVDTGPLVALIDPRDGLHRRSRADLARITDPSFIVTLPVLTETCFHLSSQVARRKLRRLFTELDVAVRDVAGSTLAASLDWLDDYADHEPDLADAITVVLSQELAGCSVWTYDRDFRTTWRRPDGSAVPLAVRR